MIALITATTIIMIMVLMMILIILIPIMIEMIKNEASVEILVKNSLNVKIHLECQTSLRSVSNTLKT